MTVCLCLVCLHVQDVSTVCGGMHFCGHVYMCEGFPGGASGKAGDTRDMGSIPGSGSSPGVGNSNPLKYSGLENPLDRGA